MMNKFRTYEYALSFYRLCQEVKPSNRVIRDQFERASLSVVLNIAEGSGRITPKDRRRFYAIALGSMKETMCLIELIQPKQSLSARLAAASMPVTGSLYKLIQNPGNLC